VPPDVTSPSLLQKCACPPNRCSDRFHGKRGGDFHEENAGSIGVRICGVIHYRLVIREQGRSSELLLHLHTVQWWRILLREERRDYVQAVQLYSLYAGLVVLNRT
jgi:hypothetical protein